MSSKKRKFPGKSRLPQNSPSSLRDLLSKVKLTTGTKLFHDIFSLPDEPTPTEEWLDWLDEISSSFPDSLRWESSRMLGAQVRVTGIYPEMITGVHSFQNQEHKVYVSMETTNPAGCSCEQSHGELPCKHAFHFANWLSVRLKNQQSEIGARINRQQYDPNPPRIEDFQAHALEYHRRQLRNLFANLPAAPASAGLNSVAATAVETERGRIAWDFSADQDGMHVDCLYQPARKKGDGWTKGKKISLGRLNEYSQALSPADRRVKELIYFSTDYFQLGPALSAYKAALELVGEPNVLVEGKSCTICSVNPTVRYEEDGSTCRLSLGDSDAIKFLGENFVIEYCGDRAAINVGMLDSSQKQCIELLQKLRPCPIGLRDEIIGYARQMQQFLTVQFPESIDGVLEPDSTNPVLLLKLGIDGSLAYSWRVRLGSGHLARTGRCPMIRPDTRDGVSVQKLRCSKSEWQAQRQLAAELQIPPEDCSGVIHDFELVLNLLQRVRGMQDLEVLWDEKSEKPLRVLGSLTPQNLRVGIKKKRDWFQLSGQCDFGEQQVDIVTLLRSMQNLDRNSIRGNYIKLGDEGWAKISDSLRKQLQRLNDSVHEERKQLVFDASSAQTVQELLHHNVQLESTQAWMECLQRMENAKLLTPVVPNNLNAELRDYQIEGFQWMRRLAEWGVGGILADDMGLGKTLQALAVVLDRAHEGPTLVIAPTSVGFNWARETQRFAPDLRPHLYRETDREDLLSRLAPGDLVICSYALVLRDSEPLSKVEWATLVLDEAQAVKNARSKTATAIAGIQAKWKFGLTGTPVENHLGDLWSVFRAVAPGVLGSWEQFRKRYAAPIEREEDEERRLALRDRLQPFILRRTKAQVLKDLPPRTESNLVVELSPDERQAYDRVRQSAIGELDDIAGLADIQDQRFRILALLTRMRQLACSPRLVHPDWPGRSSKLQHLLETLQELRSEGHRCLVFSQFVGHLQLIREMSDEEGISYQYLDGSTPANQRQQRVDNFQNGQGDVFLISLKAGGTGLNLTAADYVIHMDPWWNPAVEDQATDRAHRIGQDKPVMVYRMIAQGTIEEEILKLHESKRDLVAGVIEGSHAASKLSTQDLMELIRGSY